MCVHARVHAHVHTHVHACEHVLGERDFLDDDFF